MHWIAEFSTAQHILYHAGAQEERNIHLEFKVNCTDITCWPKYTDLATLTEDHNGCYTTLGAVQYVPCTVWSQCKLLVKCSKTSIYGSF